MRYPKLVPPAVAAVAVGAVVAAPAAHADNQRLNNSVVANVFTVQHQAGCTNDVKINLQLQQAAEWHAKDVLNNRDLDSDVGSDGSNPVTRARAAGYRGVVAETVAINPALAISGVELINQWYNDPVAHGIMANCANTQIGVWSENSLDRTVVVAVYGQPEKPDDQTPLASNVGLPYPVSLQPNVPLDPSPDYDGSDELEQGINWFPWILRGVFPAPAYPAQ